MVAMLLTGYKLVISRNNQLGLICKHLFRKKWRAHLRVAPNEVGRGWTPKWHPFGTRYPTTPLNHVYYRGVAARAGSVHLMYSNDRKLGWNWGPRTTQNNNILFLKDAHSQSKIEWPPKVHKHCHYHSTASTASNAHNDVSATPPHPQHNGTTHFLSEWSNTTSTQLPTLLMQAPAAIAPGSSCSLTNGLGFQWVRAWQRSKVTTSRACPPWHVYRACKQATTSESLAKAMPKLRTHAWTALGISSLGFLLLLITRYFLGTTSCHSHNAPWPISCPHNFTRMASSGHASYKLLKQKADSPTLVRHYLNSYITGTRAVQQLLHWSTRMRDWGLRPCMLSARL